MNIEILQSEKVIDLFGYWPMFCDSKICAFSVDTITKSIQLVLFYIDSDKGINATIELAFKSTSDIELNDFLDENILDELSIVKNSFGYTVEVIGCYGLNGSFLCESIEVKLLQDQRNNRERTTV